MTVINMCRTQYGLHQDAVAVVMSRDEEKWKKATFWVFDAPDMPFQPFEVFISDFPAKNCLATSRIS